MKLKRYLFALFVLMGAAITGLQAQCPQNFLQLQPTMNGTQLLLVVFNQGSNAMPIDLTINYGDGSPEVNNVMTSAFTWQHAYPNPGTYMLCAYGTDANGCTDSICAPVIAQPCMNGQLQLTVQDSIVDNTVYLYPSPIGGMPPFAFSATSESMSSTGYPLLFTYPIDGYHYYCVTVTDGNGCTATACDTTYTGCLPNLPVTMSAWPVQTNNVVNFVATAAGGQASYSWDFGDGSTGTGQTTAHEYAQSGFYEVCVTATTSDGCTGTYCQSVFAGFNCNVNPITSFLSPVANGDTVYVYPQTTGGCGSYTYNWTATGGQYIGGNNPAIFYFPNNGTFGVVATISDGCGCVNTFTAPVTLGCNQQSSQNVIMGTSSSVITTCYANFYDSGGSNGNYGNNQNLVQTFFPGSAGGTISVTFNSAQLEQNYDYLRIYNGTSTNAPLLAIMNGLYTLPVTYTSTAVGGALTFQFISDASVVQSGWNATVSCNQLSINAVSAGATAMDITLETGINDIVSYTWSLGDSTASTNGPSLIHTYADGGNYQVCVTVVTSEGCTYSTCEWITVPCAFQAEMQTNVSGNELQVIIPNMNPNYYYSLWIPNNNQSWQQITNDTTTVTFLYPGNFDVCLYADGNCFDSTCTSITISGEGIDTLSGVLWNDANGNGIFDSDETPIAGGYVYLCAGADSIDCQWAYTNAQGEYTFYTFDGTYTITAYANSQFAVQTFPVGNQPYTYTATGGANQDNFNFGFQNQVATISGTVYYDVNGNGNQDVGEAGVPYQFVSLGSVWAYANVNGQYSINLVPGNYTVQMNNPPAGYALTEPAAPGSYVVNATIGGNYSGRDFGFYADPDLIDLRASIHNISTVTPGFPVMNSLSYCNNSAVAQGGNFILYWDPLLEVSAANVFSPQPSSFDAANHTATWSFSSLAPGACSYIYWNSPAPLTLDLGTPITNLVMVTPLDDNNPSNNIDTTHQIVVGSWDPNDKRGTPYGVGEEGKILPNTRITYTIRFQNTGTAPAVNVVLIDTISTDFVLETLTMNNSSHNYSMQVDPNTRVIRWTFNNIMLPDSTSEPLASIGFVNFSISPVLNQTPGTRLENFCDIYFDFNEPIRTNTSVHTIDLFTIIENASDLPVVQVYPNPFSQTTNFLIQTPDQQEAQVTIHNVVGKLVDQFIAESGKTVSYDASKLSSGMYFYTVSQAGRQATGKLIVR